MNIDTIKPRSESEISTPIDFLWILFYGQNHWGKSHEISVP